MSLSAHGLAFGYGRRTIGTDVDVSFAAGRVACLLGPNGSGKTTLLRTMLGLLPPLAGEVRLDGRDLREWPLRERATRVAYVPQAAESHFDFSVGEIVEMGRSAHRGPFARPGRGDREKAAACLAKLGIAHLNEQPIHRVSGGERQLALIARALASEARHLLMDEPTANLDFGNQSAVLEEIARLRAGGVSVLFTTHQPDHALRIADEAILLRAGRVMAAGPALDIVDSANLSALYGRPIDVVDVALPGGARRRTCMARGAPDLP